MRSKMIHESTRNSTNSGLGTDSPRLVEHARMNVVASEVERLGAEAELLRVLGEHAHGDEPDDKTICLVTDDLMIMQIPDRSDGRWTVIDTTREFGDPRLQCFAFFQSGHREQAIVG